MLACARMGMRPWCLEHRKNGRHKLDYDEDVERMRERKRRRESAMHPHDEDVTIKRNKVTIRRFKQWVRTWKKDSTGISKSLIPNAGLGLRARRDFLPGDRVARASGTILDEMDRAFSDSESILQISPGVYMDMSGKDEWEGKYVNDGPHSGRMANV